MVTRAITICSKCCRIVIVRVAILWTSLVLKVFNYIFNLVHQPFYHLLIVPVSQTITRRETPPNTDPVFSKYTAYCLIRSIRSPYRREFHSVLIDKKYFTAHFQRFIIKHTLVPRAFFLFRKEGLGTRLSKNIHALRTEQSIEVVYVTLLGSLVIMYFENKMVTLTQ